MIYFIQAADGTGPVKIGFAVDPPKRIAEIQRMSPAQLKALALIEGDRQTEAGIHRAFAHLRIYGEWFRAEQELLNFAANPSQGIPERPRRINPPQKKVKPRSCTIEPQFKINEVANMLNHSQRTIRRWIESGTIRAAKFPGRYGKPSYLISKSEIEKFGVEVRTGE